MTQQIRTTGRRVVALALAVGLTAAAAFESAADDQTGRGTIVRVAQKQQPKKKGSAAKKGANLPVAGADAMAKDDAAPAAGAGDDGPSFRREIAPILVANCVGCHTGTGAGITRGKLSMASFEKLMAGGKRGEEIVAGDPGASNLVLMIKGEKINGEKVPKMPPTNGQRSLADAAVAKVEAWVKAGAKLDAGVSATDSFDKYAATPADLRRAELAKLKPEDRDKLVQQAGLDRWKKATRPSPTSPCPRGRGTSSASATFPATGWPSSSSRWSRSTPRPTASSAPRGARRSTPTRRSASTSSRTGTPSSSSSGPSRTRRSRRPTPPGPTSASRRPMSPRSTRPTAARKRPPPPPGRGRRRGRRPTNPPAAPSGRRPAS